MLWRAPLERENLWLGRPTLSGSRLFTVVDGDAVAFDNRNGTPLWRTTITRPPAWTENIVVRPGMLYVAGADSVYALDEATGAVRWKAKPDDSTAAGAYQLADERALYIGTRDHRLHALALDDGRTLWSVDLGPSWRHLGAVQGSARSGDTLFVALARWLDAGGLHRRGVVVAIDRRDGQELWRHETPNEGSFDDAPTVAGDLLLLGDVDGDAFVALDRWTGREVWRTSTDPTFLGPRASPVAVGDRVYGVAFDGHAYAMRRADGSILWKTHTGASSTHLAICGGYLLAQAQGVAIVNVANGRLERVLFDDPDDFTTSGFAVSGRRAWSAGTRAIYAFRCG